MRDKRARVAAIVCTGARCAWRDAVACCMSHRCLQATCCALAWMSHVARNHVVLKHARTHACVRTDVRACALWQTNPLPIDGTLSYVVCCGGALFVEEDGDAVERERLVQAERPQRIPEWAQAKLCVGDLAQVFLQRKRQAAGAAHASAQPADNARRMKIAPREVEQALTSLSTNIFDDMILRPSSSQLGLDKSQDMLHRSPPGSFRLPSNVSRTCFKRHGMQQARDNRPHAQQTTAHLPKRMAGHIGRCGAVARLHARSHVSRAV
jgi:hypothetical protein